MWWGCLLPGCAGHDHPFTVRHAKGGMALPNARSQVEVAISAPPASRPRYCYYHGGDSRRQSGHWILPAQIPALPGSLG